MPKVYAIDGITPVVDPSASLRGDFGRIVVEDGANIQDSCLLHGFPGKDTVVGAESTIGHGVAALAFVKAEDSIAPCSLAVGIPARVVRKLTEQELRWKKDNMHLYQQLALRSAATRQEVDALTAVEPGRKRIDIPGSVPLSELKAGKA